MKGWLPLHPEGLGSWPMGSGSNDGLLTAGLCPEGRPRHIREIGVVVGFCSGSINVNHSDIQGLRDLNSLYICLVGGSEGSALRDLRHHSLAIQAPQNRLVLTTPSVVHLSEHLGTFWF